MAYQFLPADLRTASVPAFQPAETFRTCLNPDLFAFFVLECPIFSGLYMLLTLQSEMTG